jgi:hypothetical protein
MKLTFLSTPRSTRKPKLEKTPFVAPAAALIMTLHNVSQSKPIASQASLRIREVLTVRPKVAELVFQVYGRSLHPELFEIYESREIERGGYRARVDITSAGHVISWRYGGLTLTEVAASAHHPLPQKRRLMSYRLRGERNDRLECRGGVIYQMNFELETVDPSIFWTFQQELAQDGQRQGMLYTFDSSGRMALGALSYIYLETRNRTLLVQAFHTFPDDYAIVKSQSSFQLP